MNIINITRIGEDVPVDMEQIGRQEYITLFAEEIALAIDLFLIARRLDLDPESQIFFISRMTENLDSNLSKIIADHYHLVYRTPEAYEAILEYIGEDGKVRHEDIPELMSKIDLLVS